MTKTTFKHDQVTIPLVISVEEYKLLERYKLGTWYQYLIRDKIEDLKAYEKINDSENE